MVDLSKIKKLLKERNITIRDFSGRLNMTEQGLQKLIRDNSTKVDTLEKIANELGVSVTYFFENTSGINQSATHGDNIAGVAGSVNKNTIQISLPKSGTQKIIRPDGTVEVIAGAHPGKISEENLDSEISELKQVIALLEKSLEEKDKTIEMLREMVIQIKK